MLTTPGFVKLYAHKVIQNDIQNFNNIVAVDQYARYIYRKYLKYALHTGAGIAIIFIGFAIIKFLINTNALIEGAKLQENCAIIAVEST